jgi:ribosomal protein S18 acetylase RimI-like enzyme
LLCSNMPIAIRQYQPEFLADLYRICLETGNSGGDASAEFTDSELLGAFYAAPYAMLEPDLVFVLQDEIGICGYILGTRDSQAYQAWMERSWLPAWRAKHPLTVQAHVSPETLGYQERIVGLIHRGYLPYDCVLEYPAHLHIDLLLRAQGQGWGRQLMNTFLDRLRALEVPGVHLGVGKSNSGAIQFYERLGFERLEEEEYAWVMGLKL